MTARSALHSQRLQIIDSNTMTPVGDYRNSPSLQPSFCHSCYWQIFLRCRSVLPFSLLLPTHFFLDCDGFLQWTPSIMSCYYNQPLPLCDIGLEKRLNFWCSYLESIQPFAVNRQSTWAVTGWETEIRPGLVTSLLQGSHSHLGSQLGSENMQTKEGLKGLPFHHSATASCLEILPQVGEKWQSDRKYTAHGLVK